jgi:hypothetical protein
MNLISDERGVVVDWLARLILGLAVAGVLVFDSGSLVVNYVGLDSTADDIANILATDISSGDLSTQFTLENRAKELAGDAGARVVGIGIDPQGVLDLRLKRKANTLVVRYIGPLKEWTVATAKARASTK